VVVPARSAVNELIPQLTSRLRWCADGTRIGDSCCSCMEDVMSEQTERAESTAAKASDAARKAFDQASAMARDAGAKAKRAASDTAETVTSQVKDMLDQQIGSGAAMAGQFAGSMRTAANDLDQQSPLLAGFVRNFAGRVEHYAEDLQDQTVDQLT